MHSQIPFIETIPRQKSFGCLSLKFGSIFSALINILYTIFALAQCMAIMDQIVPALTLANLENVLMYAFSIAVIISHCVTLVLTSIMLAGTLREKPHLMKPWVMWTSCLMLGNLLLMVFWSVVTITKNIDDSSFFMYVMAFLILLVRFYMLMLVSSYYKELIEESSERIKTLMSTDTWYTA